MTADASIPVDPPNPPADTEAGRIAAAQILRGVQRMLRAQGFASLAEMPLGNGRRADVMAIGPTGAIWIVEIKSSIADFHADQKWPSYCDYCDALFFAVAPDFPVTILPTETGLILADAYAGDMIRAAPETRLAAGRRKAITLSFARTAAMRLQALADPGQEL